MMMTKNKSTYLTFDEYCNQTNLNILQYKCSDMELAPYMAKAYEMIKSGKPCPTYEELKYEELKQSMNKESEG